MRKYKNRNYYSDVITFRSTFADFRHAFVVFVRLLVAGPGPPDLKKRNEIHEHDPSTFDIGF